MTLVFKYTVHPNDTLFEDNSLSSSSSLSKGILDSDDEKEDNEDEEDNEGNEALDFYNDKRSATVSRPVSLSSSDSVVMSIPSRTDCEPMRVRIAIPVACYLCMCTIENMSTAFRCKANRSIIACQECAKDTYERYFYLFFIVCICVHF